MGRSEYIRLNCNMTHSCLFLGEWTGCLDVDKLSQEIIIIAISIMIVIMIIIVIIPNNLVGPTWWHYNKA